MARLARRLPAGRDAELARLVPELMVSQLNRILRTCPEQPDGKPDPAAAAGAGAVHGVLQGSRRLAARRVLPPAGGGRRARDRPGGGTGPGVPREPGPRRRHRRRRPPRSVGSPGPTPSCASSARAPMPSTRRSSAPVIAASAARWSSTTTSTPTAPSGRASSTSATRPRHRGPLPALRRRRPRRGLAGRAPARDQPHRAHRPPPAPPHDRTARPGLRAPALQPPTWLHIHHLQHWADGGLTIPANLLCLCTLHHRELHEGLFSIDGDPEVGPLRFLDARGRPIEPPEPRLARAPPPRRAVALHPALRRTPRHRFLQLELSATARARPPKGKRFVAHTPTDQPNAAAYWKVPVIGRVVGRRVVGPGRTRPTRGRAGRCRGRWRATKPKRP